MKKFKKLGATLFLISVATLGVGITAQPAHANCLSSIEIVDFNTGQVYRGFVSCGSSAGNYIANIDTGWTGDTEGADFLCNEVGVC